MSADGVQAAHSHAQARTAAEVRGQAYEQEGAAPRYSFQGRRIQADTWAFRQAVTNAFDTHARPRCLCAPGVDGLGPPMYIARLGNSASPNPSYILKRMPGTGSQHAPHCPSYEPPAELSGLGQLLGSAIVEDPISGETTLKLDFPLSKQPGRSLRPTQGEPGASVKSDGTRLSLRGLLHYLWDQAELTRWHPGFAGKRNWAVVRKQLLATASDKFAGGQALSSKLYVPEMFSVDQRDAIHARRLAQWGQAASSPGQAQPLLLLIAEVKEIVPARYGYKAVIKHVPDQGFALDEKLYRRLGRRFEAELALWSSSEQIHMIMAATFSLTGVGVPNILELSLMPVTPQWLPLEDGFEANLVQRLVQEGRCFTKGLRYDLPREQLVANAVLTDTDQAPVALYIKGMARSIAVPAEPEAANVVSGEDPSTPNNDSEPEHWFWNVSQEVMPALPARVRAPTCLKLRPNLAG